MPNSKGKKSPDGRIETMQKRKRKQEYTRANAAEVETMKSSESTQEEKYGMLVQNIPCAVYSAYPGKTGPTTFISNKWKDWTGYSPEELYHEQGAWTRCIHPDDRELTVNTYIQACRDKKAYNLKYRIIHKDTGQLRYVRDQGHLSKDEKGAVVRVDGIVTDITELKKANNELDKYRNCLEELVRKRTAELTSAYETLKEENKERKRAEQTLHEIEKEKTTVLENLSDLMVFRDRDMVTRWASKSMAKWHGMTQDQIVGRVCYKARYGRDEPCEECHIVEAMESGQRQELEKQLPDERCWHVTVNPVFNDSGQVIGAIEVSQDITDRKKADEELRKSKDILEKTFTSLDSALFILDAKAPSVIIDCNPTATKIFGYEKQEMLGKTTEFLHVSRETLQEFQKALNRSIQEQGSLSFFEFKMQRKDGQVFPSEHSVHPLKDDKGRIIGWISIVRDITERKQSEQALRETTDLLETIFVHTHMLVACLDSQFNFVRVNRTYADADEREPSFFPGKNHFDLYPNEENEVIFRRVVETGIPYFTYARPFEYAEHPERGVSYWDWSLVPIKNPQGIVSGLVFTLADVTARKRAEEALKASEGKLNAMLQSINDHMSMMDKDLNILWANDMAKRVFGDDIIGKKCYELFHGRQSPCEPFPCLTLKAFQDGKVHEHDTQVVDKDGNTRYFHCSANVALRDSDGKSAAALEISRDITDQKLVEQALRESESSYRAVVENSAEGIVVVQGETLQFVNPALVSMFGYSKEELLSRPFVEFIHPDHRNWAMGIHIKRLKGEEVPPIYELKVLDKKGNTIWLENNGILIEWHDKPATLNFLRDVTERKKAEQAIWASENEKKGILNAISDHIIFHDKDLLIRWGNEAAARSVGMTQRELVGCHCYELWQGRSEPCERCPIIRVIETGSHTEGIMTTPDGKCWEIIGEPVFDRDGQIRGAIEIGRDITERVLAEQALQESEERFRAIYENALVGLYRTTPDGRILMANTALVQMLGYSSFEELAQLNLEKEGFALDYQRSVFKKRVEAEGRIVGLESRWMRRNGTTLFVRESARTVRDKEGEILYYEGTVADLTEHKKAEEELRIKEQKLRALLNAPTESAILVDTEGTILDINRIAAQRLGKSAESLIGMGIYDYLPADIAEYRKAQGYEVVRSGKPVRFQDEREGRYYDTNIYPVFDDEGKVSALAVFSGDITDRRRAEEVLRMSSDIVKSIPSGLFTYKYEPPDKLILLNGNPASERLANLKVSECIGKEFNDIWPEAKGKGITDNFLMVMKTGKTYETEDQYYEDEKLEGAFRIRAFPMSKELLGVAFENIIQQKLTEEALTESESRFRELVENMREVFWMENAAGTELLYISPTCEQVWGRSCQSFYENPQDWIETIHPEDRQRVNEAFSQLRETGEYSEEFRIERPDGTIRWIWDRGVLIRNEFDQVIHVAGVAEDVTERKQTEEALRESEEKFRSLAEQSPNMIFINKKGKVVYANKKCEEVIGYKREELCSPDFDFRTLVTPESMDLINDNFARHLRGEEVRPYDYSIINKDGKRIEAINASKLIQYEGEVAILGIVTDITERKRAEQALRESEERLKILFESAPDAIYLIDSEGRFIDGNRAAEELIGFAKDEVIGKSLAEVGLLSDGQLSKAKANLKKTTKGKLSGPTEYTLKRKNGIHISIEVRTFPVKIGGKMLTLGIARDITEHKRTEKKLLEHHAKLKSLASQLSLTEELERHRLATDLHDQISQSLVISKIKLDQLRKSSSSDEFNRPLEDVCSCLGQIIDDTRTLTFDLSYPILYELGFEAAVAEWLTDQIQEKHGIRTEFVDDEHQKPLDDDIRVLLFRNVRELLINVVKHAQANKVRVSIRKVKDNIRVSVEDDGVGFDPVDVASMAAKRAEFGLFSIRERLEQLGGLIEIDSEPGRGSKIMMTAPLKNEDEADGV